MTRTIDSVVFDWPVPVDHNERYETFHTDDGWAIVEEAPGRMSLARGPHTVVVQGCPYVLRVSLRDTEPVPAPPAEEPPTDDRVMKADDVRPQPPPSQPTKKKR